MSSYGSYLYVGDVGLVANTDTTTSGIVRYDLTQLGDAGALRTFGETWTDGSSYQFKHPQLLGILPDGRMYIQELGNAGDDSDDRIVLIDLAVFGPAVTNNPDSNWAEYSPGNFKFKGAPYSPS